MGQISNIARIDGKERIVIVGGGFAGLELAKKIDNKHYQVVLLDKNNYYQFQPLFYQVATGGLEPSSISYPLRKAFHKQKDVHFRMCQVEEVIADKNTLKTSVGSIDYDHLVVATGCDTNYFGNDALKETTFALKSTAESLLMRNRILLSFEQAVNTKDGEYLKEILTFVIVGGGASGVELAGALADMRKSVLPKDYPEIDFNKMEIHLVDASPRLLSAMSEKSSAVAKDTLSKRGVILHQNVAVSSYENNVVKMQDGTEITSHNVFWVGGVKANSIKGLTENAYVRGRLTVNQTNMVAGYDNIYAIGDTAVMMTEDRPNGHPQVAQVALQMAKNVAKNLNGKLKGKTPKNFEYKDKGSLATIGRNAAVADLGKLKFGGVVAWWIWLFIHLMSIVGMRNRISTFVDWVWNYMNYDVSLRLYIRPTESKMYSEEANQVEN